jgi:Histidine kinase-, DNA gyrase B-, and HSP90-like ATPase
VGARFTVQVDADQFDRLARPTQPLPAVAELVWNSLDAEAQTVTVSIALTELEGIDYVVVTDDGHGMTNEDAIRDFRKLGGSWKKVGTAGRRLSKNGKRSLHGSQGEGRFRAFALGRTAEWTTMAGGAAGTLERTVITGSMDSSEFAVSDPEELATGTPGTTVKLTQPRNYVSRLLAPQAPTWLISRFAVYLVKYPQVAVTYDGTKLDPDLILDRHTELPLDDGLGGEHGQPQLRILEWKSEVTIIRPSLVLCDENGVALHELEDIDTAGNIPFTAYVTWAGFSVHANDLLLADLGHAAISPVVDAARQAVREHLDTRAGEQRVEIIERWKAENVYPYKQPAKTPIEQHERRVFDAVATTAAPAVSREPKAAKLSLRLLQSALAESPDALYRVLQEVLDLTPDQLADFDQLLERTTLASLIHTSKLITDRLDFLGELEGMLFDEESKKRLLERKQLQRFLANGRTWVFGEEYGLAVDDKGLTKVLHAHLALLGDETSVLDPVTDTEGHTRIVDLMLSKASFASDRRQHLVVELKRPRLILTQTELNQITNYAVAVIKDDRFKAPTVTWDFWLVGDAMDDVLYELTRKPDTPGLYQRGQNYRIWVRHWAEVLEENRQRLHFYRQHLDYQPGEDTNLEETLRKYLPSDVPATENPNERTG